MFKKRRRPYRVALVGAFGCGNFGNDATLDAAMAAVGAVVPPAEVVCVCTDPQAITARFGVDATYLHGRPTDRGWSTSSSRVVRAAMRAPTLAARCVSAFRHARGVETFVVAGTGALDDQHTGPGGQPLDMALWCIAARAARARVVIVGVGAGPIWSRYSKVLIRVAARASHVVSYRDVQSLEYMRGLGRDASHDGVVPDLVFGLAGRPAVRTDSSVATVAVGVLFAGNWSDRPDALALYRGRLIETITSLWEAGYKVVLVPGDEIDLDCRADLAAALVARDAIAASELLEVPRIGSFDDVVDTLARCDAAVVSRYHNLVAALVTSCPPISLEYGFKNRAVMTSVGLPHLCRHIDDFEPSEVVRMVQRATELDMAAVDRVVDGFRRELADQWDMVLSSGPGRVAESSTAGRAT